MGYKRSVVMLIFIMIALIITLLILLKGVSESRNEKEALITQYSKNYKRFFVQHLDYSQESIDFKSINIVGIFEDLKTSNLYYEIAEQMKYGNYDYGMLYKSIINDYIVILRTYIQSKDKETEKEMKYNLEVVLKDLAIIGDWLKEKDSSDLKHLHSDEEFYKEVYPQLSEQIRINSDFHRSILE